MVLNAVLLSVTFAQVQTEAVPFAWYLRENGFTCFDMNVVHTEDFKCFRLTYE